MVFPTIDPDFKEHQDIKSSERSIPDAAVVVAEPLNTRPVFGAPAPLYVCLAVPSEKKFEYMLSIEDEAGRVQYVHELSTTALTRRLREAKKFESIEEIKTLLKSRDFTEWVRYGDGSAEPPAIYRLGLGLSPSRPYASGTFKITKVITEVCEEIEIPEMSFIPV